MRFAIVAAWRLALLIYFLKVFTRLSNTIINLVTLLPVFLIITKLTMLNLHRVVFDIMGGIRNPTAHDDAYAVLSVLTFVSGLLVLPFFALYIDAVYKRWKQRKAERQG